MRTELMAEVAGMPTRADELEGILRSIEKTGEDFVRGLGGRDGDVRVFLEIARHYARRSVELYAAAGKVPETGRDSLAGEPDGKPSAQ